MAKMMLVFLPIVAVFLVWIVVSPSSFWWRFTSRRYRHPEYNEPSDRQYDNMRGGAVFGLIALALGMAVSIYALATHGSADTPNGDPRCVYVGQHDEYPQCSGLPRSPKGGAGASPALRPGAR